MAPPAIDRVIRLEAGDFHDLEDVMVIMRAAFGDRYGEAWTRSQCAGILPMTGVALRLARDAASGNAVGFSLSRSAAGEAELLLLAVLPARHRESICTPMLCARECSS